MKIATARRNLLLLLTLGMIAPLPVYADDEGDLAKQLANPVASLISVPFQYNYDKNLGPEHDGSKSLVNIQPVIPFSITDDLNIISRTILPVVSQNDLPPGSSKAGIGDVLQSFFISPKKPTDWGLIWGVGPALSLATGSDETLSSEKWSAGPTFVALTQKGPWTLGMLGNHLWSYAGQSDRQDINATYGQPFLTYITETKTSLILNTESTYDWETNQWNIPINMDVAQLFKLGGQPMQVAVGPRYWAHSPEGGAEGWGMRAVLILLFPK